MWVLRSKAFRSWGGHAKTERLEWVQMETHQQLLHCFTQKQLGLTLEGLKWVLESLQSCRQRLVNIRDFSVSVNMTSFAFVVWGSLDELHVDQGISEWKEILHHLVKFSFPSVQRHWKITKDKCFTESHVAEYCPNHDWNSHFLISAQFFFQLNRVGYYSRHTIIQKIFVT